MINLSLSLSLSLSLTPPKVMVKDQNGAFLRRNLFCVGAVPVPPLLGLGEALTQKGCVSMVKHLRKRLDVVLGMDIFPGFVDVLDPPLPAHEHVFGQLGL
jgi:hypothetical protein